MTAVRFRGPNVETVHRLPSPPQHLFTRLYTLPPHNEHQPYPRKYNHGAPAPKFATFGTKDSPKKTRSKRISQWCGKWETKSGFHDDGAEPCLRRSCMSGLDTASLHSSCPWEHKHPRFVNSKIILLVSTTLDRSSSDGFENDCGRRRRRRSVLVAATVVAAATTTQP